MKPIHVKPSLYAFYFEALKEISIKYGYNLVLHGSMNRDLDLIAIPWQNELGEVEVMIKEFADCLGGYVMELTEEQRKCFPHGRESWIININRAIKSKYNGLVSEFNYDGDPQYYIDISVTPLPVKVLEKGESHE